MKKQICLAIIAFMAFIFCITSVFAIETLQGYVKDTNGSPLNGTSVQLYNQSADLFNSTVTDENGSYAMNYDITISGVYVLNFSKEGYVNISVNKVILNNDGIYSVNITLLEESIPLGTIAGTISNANGTLANASVIIGVNDSIIASALTNSVGAYNILVSPGIYAVSVSFFDYMTQTKEANVINGTTTTLDFALGTCSDKIKNQGETGVDCGGPCSACQTTDDGGTSSSSGGGSGGGGGGCYPSWTCTEWSECSANNMQMRTCSDRWKCGTDSQKPAETQNCIYVPESIPASNETEGNAIAEATTGGIIGITGRAVTNVLNFGKANYTFVLILIAVVVLFLIISSKMSKEEYKKAKRKKKVEEEEEKVISIHKVIRHVKKHARKIHKRVKYHLSNGHKALKKHTKKANHAVNHHVVRHVKNGYNSVKHQVNKHIVERFERASRAAKIVARKNRLKHKKVRKPKLRKRKPRIVERTTTKKTIRRY